MEMVEWKVDVLEQALLFSCHATLLESINSYIDAVGKQLSKLKTYLHTLPLISNAKVKVEISPDHQVPKTRLGMLREVLSQGSNKIVRTIYGLR